jgi:hypothetical protein
MPVYKFRTFDDAGRALVRGESDGESIARRVAALWELSARLTPPLGFRGVRKYVSLAEAEEDRRRMTVQRGGAADGGR